MAHLSSALLSLAVAAVAVMQCAGPVNAYSVGNAPGYYPYDQGYNYPTPSPMKKGVHTIFYQIWMQPASQQIQFLRVLGGY